MDVSREFIFRHYRLFLFLSITAALGSCVQYLRSEGILVSADFWDLNFFWVFAIVETFFWGILVLILVWIATINDFLWRNVLNTFYPGVYFYVLPEDVKEYRNALLLELKTLLKNYSLYLLIVFIETAIISSFNGISLLVVAVSLCVVSVVATLTSLPIQSMVRFRFRHAIRRWFALLLSGLQIVFVGVVLKSNFEDYFGKIFSSILGIVFAFPFAILSMMFSSLSVRRSRTNAGYLMFLICSLTFLFVVYYGKSITAHTFRLLRCGGNVKVGFELNGAQKCPSAFWDKDAKRCTGLLVLRTAETVWLKSTRTGEVLELPTTKVILRLDTSE